MAEQHVEDLLEGTVTRLGVTNVRIIFENPPTQ
jgi:hypothetical protein